MSTSALSWTYTVVWNLAQWVRTNFALADVTRHYPLRGSISISIHLLRYLQDILDSFLLRAFYSSSSMPYDGRLLCFLCQEFLHSKGLLLLCGILQYDIVVVLCILHLTFTWLPHLVYVYTTPSRYWFKHSNIQTNYNIQMTWYDFRLSISFK